MKNIFTSVLLLLVLLFLLIAYYHVDRMEQKRQNSIIEQTVKDAVKKERNAILDSIKNTSRNK